MKIRYLDNKPARFRVMGKYYGFVKGVYDVPKDIAKFFLTMDCFEGGKK